MKKFTSLLTAVALVSIATFADAATPRAAEHPGGEVTVSTAPPVARHKPPALSAGTAGRTKAAPQVKRSRHTTAAKVGGQARTRKAVAARRR